MRPTPAARPAAYHACAAYGIPTRLTRPPPSAHLLALWQGVVPTVVDAARVAEHDLFCQRPPPLRAFCRATVCAGAARHARLGAAASATHGRGRAWPAAGQGLACRVGFARRPCPTPSFGAAGAEGSDAPHECMHARACAQGRAPGHGMRARKQTHFLRGVNPSSSSSSSPSCASTPSSSSSSSPRCEPLPDVPTSVPPAATRRRPRTFTRRAVAAQAAPVVRLDRPSWACPPFQGVGPRHACRQLTIAVLRLVLPVRFRGLQVHPHCFQQGHGSQRRVLLLLVLRGQRQQQHGMT